MMHAETKHHYISPKLKSLFEKLGTCLIPPLNGNIQASTAHDNAQRT